MEFKHFSHPHALSFHQTPETTEAICSGCKSLLSSGSVYSCWQCNFFLHEQCFKATRSMDHPSHPSHPLSLFPFPTYPSGSFFCNFCNLTGTGFSYSCSSCEFDLHVHCAYAPVKTSHDPYPSLSNQTHSLSQETASYNPQYAYNPPETTAYGNVFPGLTPQYSFPSSHNATIDHALSTNQPPHLTPHTNQLYPSNPPYPYSSEPTSHGSFGSSPQPPYFPPNEPQPNANAQFGMPGHPISAYQHTTSFNQHTPQSKTYESNMNGPDQQHTQTPQALPYPSNPPYAHITEPKVNHPNHPYLSVNEPPNNVNVQMAAHTTPEAYQQTHSQHAATSAKHSAPEPVNVQMAAHTTPEPYQQTHAATSAKHSAPELPNLKSSADGPKQQPVPNKDLQNSNLQADAQQPRYLKHFSHHHALRSSEVEEDDYVLCSGCEQHLSGSACRCTKPKCEFQLHKSCFELPQEISHKSHPEHSLVLLASPPYKENGEFTCKACSLTGTAFDYHCKICKYDLHVKCATLSENVKREDHEHPLKLLFSSPYKKGEENNDDLTFYCDVCRNKVEDGCWVYYCQECDFGTHLDCVMEDREDPDEETEPLSEADSLLTAQMRLQQLQLQMQMNQQVLKMSQQNAQMIISAGQSLANLAG